MFLNDSGYVKLKWGSFPERMTLKGAIGFSVEKHEFILAELLVGHMVTDDGNCETCALCVYTERIEDRHEEAMLCSCVACPISHKTGEWACNGTPYEKMHKDRRKNDSYRIPNVRKQVRFLKALEASYGYA